MKSRKNDEAKTENVVCSTVMASQAFARSWGGFKMEEQKKKILYNINQTRILIGERLSVYARRDF